MLLPKSSKETYLLFEDVVAEHVGILAEMLSVHPILFWQQLADVVDAVFVVQVVPNAILDVEGQYVAAILTTDGVSIDVLDLVDYAGSVVEVAAPFFLVGVVVPLHSVDVFEAAIMLLPTSARCKYYNMLMISRLFSTIFLLIFPKVLL